MPFVFSVFLVASVVNRAAGAWEWSILDYPGSFAGSAWGVSGDSVVGQYSLPSGGIPPTHGFKYSISTNAWTPLDRPGASDTYPYGIDGNNIVGISKVDQKTTSFLYDGNQWNPIGGPTFQGIGQSVYGISGSTMVGTGGLYDGTTWTPFVYPGSWNTMPRGISGNDVVGYWQEELYVWPRRPIDHGFLYSNGNWISLDYPGAHSTIAYGVSNGKVVGGYFDSSGQHAFLYYDGTWTTLDYPGTSAGTTAYGICGNYIVGGTYLPNGHGGETMRAFLLTVPEPTTLALLALGGLFLRRRS
jgi:probable HAF family extracellular repeat protein